MQISQRFQNSRGWLVRVVAVASVSALLAACQADELGYGPKHTRSVSRETREEMTKLHMASSAPILMRIFKEESKFEVWKKDDTGKYALLKTFEICKWSGKLGPKQKEGDRQAPEGYYTITPALMNPNSSYYLSFNTGYPNAYDRSYGRTGSNLMVHGACSSAGCYAMTDEQIQEIYALARDAFRGGQRSFQLQAYPFRMTPENLARHLDDPNMPFWKMLKVGYDHFELTRQEPKVDVCGRKYVFDATPVDDARLSPVQACPELTVPQTLQMAVAAKQAKDDAETMVIAARLDEQRKRDEEHQRMLAEQRIMLAQKEAEREQRLANRKPIFETLFGDGGTETATALIQNPVTGPDGSPLPTPSPDAKVDVASSEAAPAQAQAQAQATPDAAVSEPATTASVAPAGQPAAQADPAQPTQMASAPTQSSPSYRDRLVKLISWF
ncbi:L,D-transpeptidase family protein [Hartmannibacter diazotrophicus]|nr:murein L,D-transpeptidase family protein [Hartmannibacter diazotrophicus]